MNNSIKRVEKILDYGHVCVTVTPPSWTDFRPSSITLTMDQYQRYLKWFDGKGLIQDMLPELSDEEREVLQTGISPDQWEEKIVRGEPE